MKKLNICANGVMINEKQDNRTLAEKRKDAFKEINLVFDDIPKYENVKISDADKLDKDNTNAVTVSLDLGKFLIDNPDVYEDFAYCYLSFVNINNIRYITSARIDVDPKDISFIPLMDKYDFLDINKVYELVINDPVLRRPKYACNEKLIKYLINWFNECGFLERDVNEIKQYGVIPIPSILEAFDLSLYVYYQYQDYINGNLKPFKSNMVYNYRPVGDRYEIEMSLITIKDILSILLFSYYETKFKNLRCCEYCHNYFFGRANKKCCSQRCKDLKNHKYERRKERQRNDKNNQ